jgi:hypothetical protein
MKLFEAWNVPEVLRFQSPGPSASFNSVAELKEIIGSSTLRRPDGKYYVLPRVYYGSTLTFVQNPDPDLFHNRGVMTMGRYSLDYLKTFQQELPEIDGVYLDSFGGWLGRANYRREHFAYADHPLCFDAEGRVTLLNKFSHYEWVREAKSRLAAKGQYLMVNGITPGARSVSQWREEPLGRDPCGRFFIAAYVDVAGFEPSSLTWDLYEYYRTAMGKKPFAVLERWYREQPYIESTLKRATVFNIFYSFDPLYYVRDDLRPKTRLLHERYVRIWQALYQAGWAPVTLARTDAKGVMLERYGSAVSDRFLVVYNDADSEQSFTMSLENNAQLGLITQITDLMDDEYLKSASRTDEQYTVRLTLRPRQLRVLRLQ